MATNTEGIVQYEERAVPVLNEQKRLPQQPLMAFLSLAPATSSTFPRPPTTSGQKPVRASLDGTAAPELLRRRSSSLSSDGARTLTGVRILKLGPVHYGEHSDGSKGDWYELAVEDGF